MTDDVIDLMHALGFIYLRHGQPYRAVVLLIVAGQAAPMRYDILRTLCAALVESGMGEQALEVVARLAHAAPELEQHPMMRRMHARALLLCGRTEEARRVFRSSDIRQAA